MIEKTVNKTTLRDLSEIRENLAYRLSKSPGERIEAVLRLRRETWKHRKTSENCSHYSTLMSTTQSTNTYGQ